MLAKLGILVRFTRFLLETIEYKNENKIEKKGKFSDIRKKKTRKENKRRGILFFLLI